MVTILGLGFTGKRLALRLLTRKIDVAAAVRSVGRFPELQAAGLRLFEWKIESALPRGGVLVLLVPPLAGLENEALRRIVEAAEPARLVYVSSTGVYGGQIEVTAETPAAPNDDKGLRRIEEEGWLASGPWRSLILRAAGIYGPGRGVLEALRAGKLPRSSGSGIVSRIHVDDLAAIMEAGIFSDLEGAWPVADDLPCPSAEIARWCARLLRQEPEPPDPGGAPVTGRRVDGSKIRALLNVQLRYPTWKEGVEACFSEPPL